MANESDKPEASADSPATEPQLRDDIIVTAIKFLTNPQVQGTSRDRKEAFLREKGLNTAEITAAFQRAALSPTPSLSTVAPTTPPTATWADWLKTAAMASTTAYVASSAFREYVLPLMQEEREPEPDATSQHLQRLHERVSSLEESLEQLREQGDNIQAALSSVKDLLTASQRRAADESEDTSVSLMRQLSLIKSDHQRGISELKMDVRSELQSVKSLLLNRRQFPPAPTSAASSTGVSTSTPLAATTTSLSPSPSPSQTSSSSSSSVPVPVVTPTATQLPAWQAALARPKASPVIPPDEESTQEREENTGASATKTTDDSPTAME